MNYEAEAGESIYSFLERVKKGIALTGDNYYTCIFNDIQLCVSIDSNIADLITIYSLKRELGKFTTKY